MPQHSAWHILVTQEILLLLNGYPREDDALGTTRPQAHAVNQAGVSKSTNHVHTASSRHVPPPPRSLGTLSGQPFPTPSRLCLSVCPSLPFCVFFCDSFLSPPQSISLRL